MYNRIVSWVKALLLELVNKYCTALLCVYFFCSVCWNITFLRKIVAFQDVIWEYSFRYKLGTRGILGKQNLVLGSIKLMRPNHGPKL